MSTVSKNVELEKRLLAHRHHSNRIVRIGAVNAALKKYWDDQERARELVDLPSRCPTLPAPPPWEEITSVSGRPRY